MSVTSEHRQARAAPALAAIGLFALLTAVVATDFRAATLGVSQVEARIERKLAAAEAELGELAACRSGGGPQAAAALAIVAGETALRNPLEARVEDAYAAIAAPAGLPTLGVTFGPAQIGERHYRAAMSDGRGYWEAATDRCAALAFTEFWLVSGGFDASARAGREAAFGAWSGHPAPREGVAQDAAVRAYFAFMERVYRAAARYSAIPSSYCADRVSQRSSCVASVPASSARSFESCVTARGSFS
jgi:hypothetical protein